MSASAPLPKFRAKKYHRRSFWACDECKLRKKKCDGSQPCATCRLHGKGKSATRYLLDDLLTSIASKDCTYDSKTRPSQPPTHRIRELEDDIRAVRTLLSRVRGDLAGEALTDVDAMITKLRPAAEEPLQLSSPTTTERSNVDLLQSMLPAHDRILRDGSKALSHGPYSGPAMTLAVLEFFQPLQGESIVAEILNMFDANFTTTKPPLAETRLDLVAEAEAFELLSMVFMQSHPLLRPLDKGFLHDVFEKGYRAAHGQEEPADNASSSVCHIILALGNLLSVAHHRRSGCDASISKAESHFKEGCRLIDLTDCCDMTRLQTLLLASTFLIFTSRLVGAYNFIHLAASSATQMGLLSDESHQPHHPAYVESRTIAAMINIDLYLSTVLGLKSAVGKDVAERKMDDQRIEFINASTESSQNATQDYVASQSSDMFTRHFKIALLTASTLESFQIGAVPRSHQLQQTAGIDEAVLRNAARDLANLSRDLGSPSSPSVPKFQHSAASSSVAKSGSDFAIYWSQLSMNIAFLHYLRPLADGHPVPDSASRPALTCLKIAANVIVRCELLLQSLTKSEVYSQFMHPGNFTCIYTIFLAVVALIFLISIHEGTSKPSEAWRKADSGIRILTALRCGDIGATPCLAVIKKLVSQLNYTVDFDFDNIEKTTRRVCERHTKLPTLSNILGTPASQTTWSSPNENADSPHPLNANGPSPIAMSSADKMLALAQSLFLKTDATTVDDGDGE